VWDYLSYFICCLYGKPGAYGVVTLPFSVREGFNILLPGFMPTENLRFRDESLRDLGMLASHICTLQILSNDQITGWLQVGVEGRGVN
jgi:translation initiation factor RLI1